jgi:membrane protein implicated in regulation of membrane protease activity
MRSTVLTGAAVAVAGGQVAPDVPWWGHLIMALVSVALAFFGGRSGAPAVNNTELRRGRS